ncbi:MAG: 50S ribosomal protein L3 [Pseudomonadota bacterium]
MAEENNTVPTEESHSEKAQGVDLPAFFGVKAGMTRVFDETGNQITVTVIKLIPNIVSQVKTKEKDGYEAYQVAYYEKREKLINKPKKGHLAKANIKKSLSRFEEIRMDGVHTEYVGKEVSLGLFQPNAVIDVTGVSKGKGFQGVVKRFGFQGGPAAHGSHFHRIPGSIGNRTWPARVFKGKRLPGHMGDDQVTVQNLKVVEVNESKGYLLIRGSIPGSKSSIVRIVQSVKR